MSNSGAATELMKTAVSLGQYNSSLIRVVMRPTEELLGSGLEIKIRGLARRFVLKLSARIRRTICLTTTQFGEVPSILTDK